MKAIVNENRHFDEKKKITNSKIHNQNVGRRTQTSSPETNLKDCNF